MWGRWREGNCLSGKRGPVVRRVFLFCEYVASGGANGIACSGKRRPVARTSFGFVNMLGPDGANVLLFYEYETTGSYEYERGL